MDRRIECGRRVFLTAARGILTPAMRMQPTPNHRLLFLCLHALLLIATPPDAIGAENEWPWTALVRPEVPVVQDHARVRNPIDAFVLAKLEERGLRPAPPALPRALLRRLYFGLVGFPPTPERMQAFLDEPSDEAYRRTVEKLLADEGYGERWARHWLDLVRYADTRGGAIDYPRPHMWRYRDYVIRAFNQDRPYDRFIREQLAGDAFGAYGDEGKLGLAFLSLWVQVERDSGEQSRRDYLVDVVGTTGSVFLGVTLDCARCHDHKFDPIPTRDFYRLEAFFAPLKVSVTAQPFHQYELPKLEPERWKKKVKEWEGLLARRKELVDQKMAEFRDRLRKRRFLGAPADLKDLVVPVSDGDLKKAMAEGLLFSKEERDLHDSMRRKTARFANPNSPDYYKPMAYTATDSSFHKSIATHILAGGNYKLRGEAVQVGFLAAAAADSKEVDLEGLSGSRRKLLAGWISSPENPLTARVLVNRIWQHHFGKGLVATPSDFGKQGRGTVHRDLLDWLAWTFVQSGWSVKDVHRLILDSNVYRQSMRHPASAECEKLDPENHYLWVRDAMRLDAEVIRDTVLATSGQLNRAMGGPPFFPEADDALLRQAPTWFEPSSREERNRRSIYMLQSRSFQLPMMKVFNGPNIDASCPERGVTAVTPQVFSLFNSKFAHEQSRFMAERVAAKAGDDPDRQIELAFQLAFQRPPTGTDLATCRAFLARPDGSLFDLCLVILNMNEFVYLE